MKNDSGQSINGCTADVKLGDIDGELISIEKCICGKVYAPWEESITVYDEGTLMPCCNRRLFFHVKVHCYEVES